MRYKIMIQKEQENKFEKVEETDQENPMKRADKRQDKK